MITNDELRQKVVDMLKQAGINAAEVAASPVALDRAAKVVTGLLPFVLDFLFPVFGFCFTP